MPITITNEKMLCGLGDRDPATGDLRAEAMDRALTTLKRFAMLIDFERPETLEVFATAAVRDAPNGKDFLREINTAGLRPQLLSGEEEARLAGLGILCSAPEIQRDALEALGGDLGGGSLELSRLSGAARGEIKDIVSLPIGSLRLLTEFGDRDQAAVDFVDEQFSSAPWLSDLSSPHLYIVGGAWRAIARVGMWMAEHPVPILDHYSMDADQALEVCGRVERSSPEELGQISGVQKKRTPTLPMSAMVLRRLIERSGAQRVVVSACGVREGLLFDQLPEAARLEEPLEALAKDLAARQTGGRLPDPEAVARLTDPLFSDQIAQQRLRRAAAMLIRMANITHPDQRTGHASAVIMSAPFLGLDHNDRCLLAAMVKAHLGSSLEKSDPIIPLEVLSDADRTYALQVGRAHRLASSLRTPLYQKRSGFSLKRADDRLLLQVAARVKDLVVEQVVKDLDRLADALSLPAEIQYTA
ncbi:MAG: hypothetical protein AAGG79_01500 [Pseudomonadota bacterium]